jgi:hypothetical protein
MAKAIGDWTPFNPGEIDVLGFDFTDALAPGDSVASSEWSCVVNEGTDPDVDSRIIGSSETIANVSSQKVGLFLAGVEYYLVSMATTTNGNALAAWADLSCETIGC